MLPALWMVQQKHSGLGKDSDRRSALFYRFPFASSLAFLSSVSLFPLLIYLFLHLLLFLPGYSPGPYTFLLHTDQLRHCLAPN